MQTECKRVQTGCVGRRGGTRERYGARGCRCTWAAAGARQPTCPGRRSGLCSASVARELRPEPPGISARPPPAARRTARDRWRTEAPTPVACALSSFRPSLYARLWHETLILGLFRNHRAVTHLFQVLLCRNREFIKWLLLVDFI